MFEQDLVLEQTELLDLPETSKRIDERINKKGKLQKLEAEAQRRGFKPLKGPKGELGIRQKFRSRKPVQPPADVKSEPVQDLEFQITLRTLTKEKSQDQAAIATLTITAGTNSEEYDLLLEAPSGNFAQASEFMMEGDQVVLAHSWWSAVRSCLISKCGSVCVGALFACGGTWVAYLGCVAAACGGCWARCLACASCDCSWWCRWAAGCCDR